VPTNSTRPIHHDTGPDRSRNIPHRGSNHGWERDTRACGSGTSLRDHCKAGRPPDAQSQRCRVPLSQRLPRHAPCRRHGGHIPGFPTDMQAQWTSLMSDCGRARALLSPIRYISTGSTCSPMDAARRRHRVKKKRPVIRGVGASRDEVMSTDPVLPRPFILAGLVASRDRPKCSGLSYRSGYEAIEKKLQSLGADIRREAGEGISEPLKGTSSGGWHHLPRNGRCKRGTSARSSFHPESGTPALLYGSIALLCTRIPLSTNLGTSSPPFCTPCGCVFGTPHRPAVEDSFRGAGDTPAPRATAAAVGASASGQTPPPPCDSACDHIRECPFLIRNCPWRRNGGSSCFSRR